MQLLPSEMHNAPAIPGRQKLDLRAKSAILHPDSTLHLQLKGHDLTNVAKGFFSNRTSSPALRIQAFNDSNGRWKMVAKSEAIELDLNPEWPVLKLRCASLCRCDMERPIRVSVWDEGQGDQTVAMGHFETTVKELLSRHQAFIAHGIPFRYDVVQSNDNGVVVNVGKISVVRAEMEIASEEGVQNERQMPKQRSASHLLQNSTDNLPLQSSSSHQTKKEESRRKSIESKSPKKEEKEAPRRFLRLKLRGRDLEELPGMRMIGHTDQPVACSRAVAVGRFDMGVPGHNPFRTVHTTRVVPNDCNPPWPEICLPINEVCFQGDLDSPVLLSALEEGRQVMGWCQTTVRELVKGTKRNGTMSLELQDNRKRRFGKIEVVSAEIEQEESEEESSSSEEAAPVTTGWLQRTLDLASSLASSATTTATNTSTDQPGEPEKASKREYYEHKQEQDTNKENDNSTRRNQEEKTKIEEESEDEESEEESSDDEDDSSVDSSDSEGSFITVADVVSLAEKSMSSGECTPEQKQGLLELKLKLMQTPTAEKPSAEKPNAADILAGMPGWSLDGDSVVGTPKIPKQQAQQRISSAGMVSVEDMYLDEASAAGEHEEKPQDQDDIADINRLIQQAEEQDDKNDDLVADMREDDEILRRQEQLTLQAKEEKALRKQEEGNFKGKKAKKKVQNTLKSIHRILKDNLTSIPENEQAANASTRDKSKKKKNAISKGMDRFGKSKSRNKKESRGRNTASRMLDRDRTRATDLIRGRSRSPFASARMTRSDNGPTMTPVFDTAPFPATSPAMPRPKSDTRLESRLGRSQSPTPNHLTASAVAPPTQNWEAGRSKSPSTRRRMSAEGTKQGGANGFDAGRSSSPSTRRRMSAGGTPTSILSGVSGFDAVRSRSRSPSWRVRNISGVRGRSSSPSFQNKQREQSEAIDRLVEMGFDRDAALGAYLVSNKDEMAAANMLMDAHGLAEKSGVGVEEIVRRRARSRSAERNGLGLRRTRSRSTEHNGPVPSRARSRSTERNGPAPRSHSKSASRRNSLSGSGAPSRARSRSIERNRPAPRSRRYSLSGSGAGENTTRGEGTHHSTSPTQHDNSTRAGLRDGDTSTRRGNRSSATTPRSGEGRPTRRTKKSKSFDDAVPAGKPGSSKSRSRRKATRTKSNDDPGSKKPATRAKSSDEPGSKQPIKRTKSSDESRPIRRKKSSRGLRKSISFVEGNATSDGGDFAKQFAVGKKPDSTIDQERAAGSFAAPSLHESFPAPRSKSPMTSKRSSHPGIMTQEDSHSSLRDRGERMKRSRRRRNSLSGTQKSDNNPSPDEAAKVTEGGVLQDSYPKTKQRSPTRRYSLSDANTDETPGIQEKRDMEESLEMQQLSASENAFDADWGVFPPPVPPLPDQDTGTEGEVQNPEQEATKKTERRSSLGGVNKSIGKHFKKDKSKGGNNPLSYLVSQGLTDEQAQAVIEEADITRMEDLSIMDNDMVSEVAKAAGLKLVPAKKLSNAIKLYSEKAESMSLPSKFDTNSVKKGFLKVAGGFGKGVKLTGKGAYSAGAAAAGAMEGLGKKSSKNKNKNKVKPAALADSDGHMDKYHEPKLDIGL